MIIRYNGVDIEMDDRYSQKDFTGKSLVKENMSGINIYGACFSQENPRSEIFPNDMAGVTFFNCNLDNCIIPPGNIMMGGSNRAFKVQFDLRDWEIDGNGTPIKVLNEIYWDSLGLSTDPLEIPKEKITDISEIPVKKVV